MQTKFSSRSYCQLLQRLTSAELDDVEAFLKMPSFRLNKTHFLLYKQLKKAWPNFSITKEQINKHLFSSAKNDVDAALNKALWELHQGTEKWLLYQQRFETEEEKKLHLAAAYAQRNLPSLFFKKNAKALDFTHTNGQEDSSVFYWRSKLYEQLYYHPDTSKTGADIPAFKKMNQNLDYSFHALKLSLITEQLVRKTFVTDEKGIAREEVHIAFAANNRELPYFDFYHDLIELIKNHNDLGLKNMIEKFKKNRSVFSKQGQMQILNFLFNRITDRINLGFSEHHETQFKLYQFGLDNDLIVINGRMTFASYNNIFSSACLFKEYKFAEKHLQEHYLLLEPKIRDDAHGFLQATLWFLRGKYEKTMVYLRGMKFRDIDFKLLARILELRCAFELFAHKKAPEKFVTDNADSCYKFLKGKKQLSENKKVMYLNFIKMCKAIVKLRTKPSSVVFRKKKEFQGLLADEHYVIVLRSWLQEKVNGL